VLVRADSKLVLIASNGGSDQHPAWFLNLLHQPLVSVETRDRRIKARARLSGPGERDELWPQIDAAYSGYRNYREKTTREIPVIILDPVP
jgi:deazaflavin-dependent oxidoreductase (nitroreductase family)